MAKGIKGYTIVYPKEVLNIYFIVVLLHDKTSSLDLNLVQCLYLYVEVLSNKGLRSSSADTSPSWLESINFWTTTLASSILFCSSFTNQSVGKLNTKEYCLISFIFVYSFTLRVGLKVFFRLFSSI